MFRLIYITLALFAASSLAEEQKCIDSITPSTNPGEYQINSDGTVTDTSQQIVWQRCPRGQRWENNTCSGKVLLVDWIEAKTIATAFSKETSLPWRLPTVHELGRITELRCENPAINLELFPMTPSTHFWTGIKFANDNSSAWQIFFGTGENHTAKKSGKAAVRLMRPVDKISN